MMEKLREQLIEAIKFKDIQKLLKLKEHLATNAFLEKYTNEDGTIDVPIGAWMEELPEIARQFGINNK